MRRLVFAFLALAACRERDPEQVPPDARPTIDAYEGPRLRVATFNVRRFFDAFCETGACGPGEYEAILTPPQMEARAQEIADAVRALDPDVIALQEIETQACLDAILARTTDFLPHGELGEIGEEASVDVAILSKTPIDSVVRHRDAEPLVLPSGFTTTFSRELLEVHTRAQDVDVVMFAAHFKAKSNDDPPRRLAEAQVSARLVNLVAAREPNALVVLAGDLNDTPGSPPIDALVVDGNLVRVADDLPTDAQATYIFNGQLQSIDHLLIARTTAAMRRLPRSSRVWRTSGDDGYGGSDHAALTSDFTPGP